jgi:DNA-binding MarR family transcriptional regulator
MAGKSEAQTWWRELERLSRALGQIGPDEVCCEGLTVRQCGILRMLMAAEGARISDLALSVWLSPSAMTRALERLEAEGLVQRVRGATDDGRAATVAVTTKGRRVRQRIDQLMLDRTQQIINAIPANARRQVLDALRIFNHAMENGPCCTFNPPAASRTQKEKAK